LLNKLSFPRIEEIWKEVYAMFGFTLKASQFKIRKGPVGCRFLGAECVLVDGSFFVPSYDYDRIYSALVSDLKPKTEDETIGKWYALLHLSWHHVELFNSIRQAIVHAIRDCSGAYVDFLREQGVPTREKVVYGFWLGSEGSYFEEDSKWMEEAFKNELNQICPIVV